MSIISWDDIEKTRISDLNISGTFEEEFDDERLVMFEVQHDKSSDQIWDYLYQLWSHQMKFIVTKSSGRICIESKKVNLVQISLFFTKPGIYL